MTVETSQEVYYFKILGYKLERPAYVVCEWFDVDEKDYMQQRFHPEQLQVRSLDLNRMDFKNLREFERDAIRRSGE